MAPSEMGRAGKTPLHFMDGEAGWVVLKHWLVRDPELEPASLASETLGHIILVLGTLPAGT